MHPTARPEWRKSSSASVSWASLSWLASVLGFGSRRCWSCRQIFFPCTSVVQRPTAWEVFESKPTCSERGCEWRKKNVNKNSHDIGLFLFGHFLIQERNASKVIKGKKEEIIKIERRSKRTKIVLLPNVSEKLEGEKCTRREKKRSVWDLTCQQVGKLAKLHTNPSGEEIYHVLRSESKILTTARKKVILWIFRLCCETNPHNSFENSISEQLEREQQNSGRWAICNSVFLRNFISREYLTNWQIWGLCD